jgi:ribulose-5-phosphate 4-epimerase/fuculose-1-phosphate aldolase
MQHALAQAVRILHSAGLLGIDGAVSARDGNAMWINARGVNPQAVTPADFVRVDLRDGSTIEGEGEPPDEHHLHRAIFMRRPDAGAIAHTTPEHVVALSIAGRALVPVNSIGSFLPETTPVFDEEIPVTTVERAAAVAEALGDSPALVLRGRGLVIAGPTVETALAWTTSAEENARHLYHAALLGDPAVLRGAELAAVARENWAPIIVRKHWNYQAETARKAGAFEGLEG